MPILITKNDEQYGPYELSELQEYVHQGSFLLTDLCWQEGWEDWQPISSIVSRPPPVAAPSVQVRSMPAQSSAAPNTKIDEHIVWEGHATLWRHAGSIFWSIVISLLLAVFTFGVGIILAPIWWFAIYFEHKKRKYIVTSKRVKIEFGLFAKSSNEIRVKDIRNVNIVKKGLAGLFGIGTLEFSSSGGSGIEVSFSAISNAAAIKEMINDMQD